MTAPTSQSDFYLKNKIDKIALGNNENKWVVLDSHADQAPSLVRDLGM